MRCPKRRNDEIAFLSGTERRRYLERERACAVSAKSVLTRLREVRCELTQPSGNFGRPKMGKASALSLPLRTGTAELVLGSRARGLKERARSVCSLAEDMPNL